MNKLTEDAIECLEAEVTKVDKSQKFVNFQCVLYCTIERNNVLNDDCLSAQGG